MIEQSINKIYDKITKDSIQKTSFICCIVIYTLLFFVLNRLYPLFADDWVYSFVFGSEESRRISSLYDVIDSQRIHYIQWGGRLVVHFIAQFFLLLDTIWFDIANTVMNALFVYLIYRFANYGNKTNVFVLILTILLTWFCQPAFAGTLLWLIGSSNYLWGTAITLLFVYPYYKHYRQEAPSQKSPIYTILFCLFGIIAGWTNENMSLATILMLFILCIYFYTKDKSLPRWAIFGLIGMCVGCLLMLVAPGNYVRMDSVSEAVKTPDISFVEVLLTRWTNMLDLYIHYILPIVGVYLISFIAYKYHFIKEKRREILFISLLFMATAHVAFIIMIASPEFPTRALFGIITYIIISIGILYANINMSTTLLRMANLGISLFLILFAYDYNQRYEVLHRASEAWEKRNNYMMEQKEQGVRVVEIEERILIPHSKFHLYDISTDSNDDQNKAYAKFHGVDSVKIVEPK